MEGLDCGLFSYVYVSMIQWIAGILISVTMEAVLVFGVVMVFNLIIHR